MRYLLIAALLASISAAAAPTVARPAPAAAPTAAPDLREEHRIAARKMLEVLSEGAILRGDVEQNGSQGKFEAFFYDGEWLVRESFGTMVNEAYFSEASGAWSGGNYALPFQIDEHDSPANTVLNMLGNGAYLEEENWQYFVYEGEEAAGYRFRFAPPELPPVGVLLYSDPAEPEYLQLKFAEVAIAPGDPKSIRHRSYYEYQVDAEGQLYSQRETGKEIDQDGRTVNNTIYTVRQIEQATQKPASLVFDTTRKPVGNAGVGMTGPVTIAVDTTAGYFVLPVTFKNGETLKFILDTGASASLFSPAAVHAAGLDAAVVTMAYGHGSKQEFEMGMVDGASLGSAAAGLLPLVPFPATKIPSSSRDVLDTLQQLGCAGILGVSPLHQYVATLDFNAKQIVFTPQQLFDPATAIPGPHLTFSLDAEDLIYVKARVNDGLIGQIAIDTGLQQGIALLRETMDFAGLSLTKVDSQTSTVVGGKKDFDLVTVNSFDLGPLRLENRTATITEDDRGSLAARRMLGFLGIELFREARVTLDLFAQRMYVEPPAELLKQMEGEVPEVFNGLADELYPAPKTMPVPFGGPAAQQDLTKPAPSPSAPPAGQ
jgi:predicted aspartyl protease